MKYLLSLTKLKDVNKKKIVLKIKGINVKEYVFYNNFKKYI